MSWDGLRGTGVDSSHSELETTRFGVTIGRVTVRLGAEPGSASSDPAAALRRALAESADDVLVVRYPAAALHLAAVVASSGRHVLPAGALTYWGVASQDLREEGGETPEGLDVVTVRALAAAGPQEAVTPGTVTLVERLVAGSFDGYGNHYRANPLLDPGEALAGYQEWAVRSATSSPDDALVLRHDGRAIGLATLSAGADGSHLEVLLAGLVTEVQGRGWYGTLLRACAAEAVRRGCADLVISTQAHNVRVQRAWARAGLRPFAAVETVHAVRPGLLDVP